MLMRVEFYKGGEGRLCGWIATPPHRRAFQGSTMAAGRDLPHDLTQFTIERALEIRDGFWGLLAHGASFASVPGRRVTRPGRALVRAYHAELVAVEGVVNWHYLAWKRSGPTPLRPTLDARYARWRALAEGERLMLEWPVHPLPNNRIAHVMPPTRSAARASEKAHSAPSKHPFGRLQLAP
jgi:hypothetical protein